VIGKKVQSAMNDQLNAETYSAYLYWSMAAYFESVNLPGFANWMRIQAQEEMVHAAKFFDYVCQRHGRVLLKAIEGPPTEWKSPLAAFEAAFGHEQKVTALINKLVDLAIAEKDHAANSFLQWFVNEQVEEEASADEIVQKLKRIKGDEALLLMLDKEMAQRVFTPPAEGQSQ